MCFVMMPMSDPPPYSGGHFRRVYDYIIKPACDSAGFRPLRADEVNQTNYIVLDVLRQIVEAPMAICDLSGRNPNVFYELGVRQAFNKPVTLIKDLDSVRAFDIQGLRDIEYDHALRIDTVAEAVATIADSLRNTFASHTSADGTQINSVVQLLGVQEAHPPQRRELSAETSLLLTTMTELGDRMSAIEASLRKGSTMRAAEELSAADRSAYTQDWREALRQAANAPLQIGTHVKHRKFGVGVVQSLKGSGRDLVAGIVFEDEAIGRKNLVVAQAQLEVLSGGKG